MTKALAFWQRLRWELGTGGLAAALVLALALLYAAVAIPATRQALVRKRAQADELIRQAGPPAASAGSRDGTAEQLQAFYAAMPREKTATAWLGKIERAAAFSGLRLRSGEYRLERRPDSPVLAYHLTLPVNGSYGQVRAFIGQVLEAVPYASLDEIQLTRESPQSRALEARLRFSLYLLADAP